MSGANRSTRKGLGDLERKYIARYYSQFVERKWEGMVSSR